MKSFPLPVHDRITLMAFQVILPSKTVYVGLTTTPDMNQISEIGQQVLNAVAAYSEGKNFNIFQISQPKNVLNRFRTALGLMADGDAILVMEARDGLSGPIIKALNIQEERAEVPVQYSVPENWSLVLAVEQTPPSGSKH
jgi:hypothetical protein